MQFLNWLIQYLNMLFVPHPAYSEHICQLYTSNVSKRILKNYYGANLFPNCLLDSGHVNKILFPCGKRQETMKQLLYTYVIHTYTGKLLWNRRFSTTINRQEFEMLNQLTINMGGISFNTASLSFHSAAVEIEPPKFSVTSYVE